VQIRNVATGDYVNRLCAQLESQGINTAYITSQEVIDKYEIKVMLLCDKCGVLREQELTKCPKCNRKKFQRVQRAVEIDRK